MLSRKILILIEKSIIQKNNIDIKKKLNKLHNRVKSSEYIKMFELLRVKLYPSGVLYTTR